MFRSQLQTIVGLIFLIAYVGAYLALVRAEVWHRTDHGRIVGAAIPRYAIAENTSRIAFAPIHWLDERVRRDYWQARGSDE